MVAKRFQSWGEDRIALVPLASFPAPRAFPADPGIEILAQCRGQCALIAGLGGELGDCCGASRMAQRIGQGRAFGPRCGQRSPRGCQRAFGAIAFIGRGGARRFGGFERAFGLGQLRRRRCAAPLGLPLGGNRVTTIAQRLPLLCDLEQVRFGAVPLSVPCAGPVTTMNSNASFSTSEPVSTTDSAVSWFVVRCWPLTAGASLTGSTVTRTVAIFESTWPSLALNMKLSGPL